MYTKAPPPVKLAFLAVELYPFILATPPITIAVRLGAVDGGVARLKPHVLSGKAEYPPFNVYDALPVTVIELLALLKPALFEAVSYTHLDAADE